MAQPVTFITLRQNARQLVDQNLPNNFITETNLGVLINRSAQRLYEFLIQLAGDNYAWSTTTLTTVANQDTYGIVSATSVQDFYKLIGVDLYTSPVGASVTTKVTLRRLLNDERNLYNTMLPTSWSQFGITNVRYYVEGGYPNAESIVFKPQPVPNGQLIGLIYAPVLQPMVADSDTFPFGQWAEYIETDTALKMAAIDRDFEQVNYLMARLADIRASVESAAENRDAGEPMRIVDVNQNGRAPYGFPRGWA